MARRPRDPVKFPFGDSADSNDPDAEGSSGDSSRDPVKFPFGSSGDGEASPFSSSGSKSQLPNQPPDARPDDDASLESLGSDEALSSDEELVHLGEDSDQGSISARVSDLGPISPSGPLVIIDDDDEGASSRYHASIVDDSARLAGSKKPRAPKRGEGAGRGKQTGKRPRATRDDDIDADVPMPDRSARAGRQSGRAGAPAPVVAAPAGRGGAALRMVLTLLAVAAALGVGEVRRRKDLEAQGARHAMELAALRTAQQAALEREQRAGQDAVAGAEARAAQDRQVALERAAQERERAVGDARREADAAARADAERAAREAVTVELARAAARADEARAREVEEAARRARDEERALGETALAEQTQAGDERRLRELDALRKRLEAELSAASTRAEEEAMARMLAEERAAALDRAQPAGGGSAAEPVDDWDSYFTDTGGAGAASSGEDDPFAVGGGDAHPVDRLVAWARENLHGSLGYRNLSHFSRGASGDDRKTRHELRLRLDYRDWLWRSDDATMGLRLVSLIDVRVDDADYAVALPHGVDDEERRRPIVVPEELHVDLNVDWLTLRGGYQVFAWGTGDLFNPTDILNPIDFSDLFDTRRIGVLAASVEATFEHVSLELAAIPTFTRSRLPLRGRRFDVLGRQSPLAVLRPDDPDSSVENAQWGARAVGHAGGWDVSLSGFTGFDDLPSARIAVLSAAPLLLVVDPVYDRLHMVGADFATTLGFLGGSVGDALSGVQVHGEVAHFFVEGERQDDFVQGVIGINYTWIDLIFEHDLTLVLEYAGDATTHRAEGALPGVRLNRILRGAVLARLEYAVDDDLSFELNAALITHGEENALIHPGVRWNVTDNLRLELGGDIFVGPEDTFFGQFKRDGRAIFDIKWVF